MKFFAALTLIFGSTSFAQESLQEKIRDVVVAHLKDVKACYEEQIKKGDQSSGQIDLQWQINDQGQVTQVKANKKTSTYKNIQAQNCISEEIKSLKFPPAAPHQSMTITYPFNFAFHPKTHENPSQK